MPTCLHPQQVKAERRLFIRDEGAMAQETCGDILIKFSLQTDLEDKSDHIFEIGDLNYLLHIRVQIALIQDQKK